MAGFLQWLGVSSSFQIRMLTALKGRKVGEDPEGNSYYVGKPRGGDKRERRWVIYTKNDIDASRVPPEWHAWLHHQSDVFPHIDSGPYRRRWQKPHQRNQTGTAGAYVPDGHTKRGAQRSVATGDYEPWQPAD